MSKPKTTVYEDAAAEVDKHLVAALLAAASAGDYATVITLAQMLRGRASRQEDGKP